ncbi:protein-S-isoprenylcysteine O-methyltransferase isoform X2 [Danaus plexippus]|uniref:protein-S-isoprenylcysteine O-methyltransferase isoform X2 n=1 Tax=Danaus plexippus TaxID=13037 RepID=UPI002AB00C38|nr:protein-S-isoprenylcysteine O-methyltransferase isoform X2 [Danaus plexippus]
MENVCPAAKQSLLYFALSSIMFVISFFSASVLGYTSELWALTYWGPALYFCLLNFILRYFLKGFTYEVATRAALLGSVFATGLYFATFDNSFHIFGLYAMAISMFHFSEFFTVALTNPQTLTVDSFILNHSSQYWIAAVTSWLEAGVEYYFFPSMKSYFWLSHIGVVMCIVGELFRKVAMFTAKTNFNHHIILLNPVCVVIYTLVSWMFFNERIFAEEMFLISFFGKQYLEYQKRVSTGLPFIKGVVMDGVS